MGDHDEHTALCPTCGGLPCDYTELAKLRSELAEAREALTADRAKLLGAAAIANNHFNGPRAANGAAAIEALRSIANVLGEPF